MKDLTPVTFSETDQASLYKLMDELYSVVNIKKG